MEKKNTSQSGGTPVAFGLAGIVALLTTYSYSKLSVAYPSEGGTVEFINQAFKPGFFTGGMNVLLWLSYVVMLGLSFIIEGIYKSITGKDFKKILDPNLKENKGKNLE